MSITTETYKRLANKSVTPEDITDLKEVPLELERQKSATLTKAITSAKLSITKKNPSTSILCIVCGEATLAHGAKRRALVAKYGDAYKCRICRSAKAQRAQRATSEGTTHDCIVTIGADPELLAISDVGRIINANQLYQSGSSAEVGADGGGTPFELRPKACNNALELTKELRRLMQKLLTATARHSPKSVLVAGAGTFGYSIGGHVHYGTKDLIEHGSIHEKKTIAVLGLSAIAYASLQTAETLKQRQRNRNNSYGNLYDYRPQNHGIEYRALPSWLTTPENTAQWLCFTHSLVIEGLNAPENFKKLFTLAQVATEELLNGISPTHGDTADDWKSVGIADLKHFSAEGIAPIIKTLWCFKNNYCGYKPFLKALAQRITTGDTIGNVVDVGAWNLREPVAPKAQLVNALRFSNDDFNMSLLRDAITREFNGLFPCIPETESRIYVYGANNAEADHERNDLLLCSQLYTISVLGDYNSICTIEENENSDIGVTRRMRENPESIARVAKAIKHILTQHYGDALVLQSTAPSEPSRTPDVRLRFSEAYNGTDADEDADNLNEDSNGEDS